MGDKPTLKFQPGPQTKFAQCTADVCIFGGQAGGGKSHALLLEAARWVPWKGYEGVVFRRNRSDMEGSGGLWNKARELYSGLFGGASFRGGGYLDATWRNGSQVQLAHLNLESDVVDNWQGRELAFVGMDELTHFTAKQFWYIMTRLRSTCGVRPYLRATCNPDPDSFVADLISWWIGEDGYPIPERDGVLRWFCRNGDDLKWFDSQEECQAYLGILGDKDQKPKSLTFIASRLEDNPALLASNPDYRSQIAMQDAVTRAQLLGGNWKIRARAGGMFNRMWFEVIDQLPPTSQWGVICRGWDKAATRPNPQYEDPDWTRGVKGIWQKNGTLVIADMVSMRDAPGAVEELIAHTAQADGRSCIQAFWQDGGQSGVVDKMHTEHLLMKKCPNTHARFQVESKNKLHYAKPFSAFCDPQTTHGVQKVYLLRAPWNAEFLHELERFPKPTGEAGKGIHDDIVDACSRMWIEIEKGKVGGAGRFMQAMAGARA